jgi:hypothetical protein
MGAARRGVFRFLLPPYAELLFAVELSEAERALEHAALLLFGAEAARFGNGVAREEGAD